MGSSQMRSAQCKWRIIKSWAMVGSFGSFMLRRKVQGKDSGSRWKSAAEGKAGEKGLLVQTLTSKEMLPLPEGSPLITPTITLGIESDNLAWTGLNVQRSVTHDRNISAEQNLPRWIQSEKGVIHLQAAFICANTGDECPHVNEHR